MNYTKLLNVVAYQNAMVKQAGLNKEALFGISLDDIARAARRGAAKIKAGIKHKTGLGNYIPWGNYETATDAAFDAARDANKAPKIEGLYTVGKEAPYMRNPGIGAAIEGTMVSSPYNGHNMPYIAHMLGEDDAKVNRMIRRLDAAKASQDAGSLVLDRNMAAGIASEESPRFKEFLRRRNLGVQAENDALEYIESGLPQNKYKVSPQVSRDAKVTDSVNHIEEGTRNWNTGENFMAAKQRYYKKNSIPSAWDSDLVKADKAYRDKLRNPAKLDIRKLFETGAIK